MFGKALTIYVVISSSSWVYVDLGPECVYHVVTIQALEFKFKDCLAIECWLAFLNTQSDTAVPTSCIPRIEVTEIFAVWLEDRVGRDPKLALGIFGDNRGLLSRQEQSWGLELSYLSIL